MKKSFSSVMIFLLCLSMLAVFAPKAKALMPSLNDNFEADSSLNTSLWQVNGPVGTLVGTYLSDIPNTIVTPTLTFSSTNGMGVSGVTSSYESATIQSVQSFSTPFALTGNVMGASPTYAVAFLLGIASSDESQGVVIDANLAASSGYLGIWYQIPNGVNSWTGYQGPILSNPSINVLYQVSISVDAAGLATLSISSQGNVLGTASVQVGTGNYYAILGQREGAPIQTGPNQAYWQSVTVSPASSDFIWIFTPAINGLTVDVNGATSSSGVAYIGWNWGDGSSMNGYFPESHTYVSNGDYTITVTSYYNDGTTASTSAKVDVYLGALSGGDKLTITAGSGGSVSYVSTVGSGSIPSGGSRMLYLAFEDGASLTANPSSGYSFNSWTVSSGITGLNSAPIDITSPSIATVVSSDSSISANFASGQSSPLSVNIVQNPATGQWAVPFTTTFTADASGGSTPYSISWTVISASGNSYVGGNPFTYTFKYAGTYSVKATVTDSKSNTASDSMTIEAFDRSDLVTLQFVSGNVLALSGTPCITLEQDGQQRLGIVETSSTAATLGTDVKVNWGGIVLPGWAYSFLGFSNPWYDMSVSDGFGDSAQLSNELIQISFDDTQPIVASFPFNPSTALISPLSLWQELTFKVSPFGELALDEDIVSAVFAAAGVTLPDLTLYQTVAMDFASSLSSSGIQIASVITNGQLLLQDAPVIFSDLHDTLENLASSIGGTVALYLTTGATEAGAEARSAAAEGVFVYDMVALSAVLAGGDRSDTYQISEVIPLLSVVVDPNDTLNAILSTPQGDVGYNNGIWENTGNLSDFVYTDITNNTYGFAIPITDQNYNANLTITSLDGATTPFMVVVSWENQTTELGGTVHGDEADSYQLSFVNGLSVTSAITFNQLGIDLGFARTMLVVDGTPYNASQISISFIWPVDSVHTFAFQSPLTAAANAEQYVWTGTTGLSSLQSDSINVTGSGSIVGNYETQYYLTLTTSPSGVGCPTGAGWYDANSYASISTDQYANVTMGCSRYNFTDWTTSDMTEITSPNSPSTTVLMDTAKTVTSEYVKQYYLNMSTGFGTVSPGSGWFNAGSKVTISATAPFTIVGERYLGIGWFGLGCGSYSGFCNPAVATNVTMKGPVWEFAIWNHQYLLTVKTNDLPSPISTEVSLGWFELGKASDASSFTMWISAGAPTGKISVDAFVSGCASSGTRYVFRSWADGTTASSHPSILMNGPQALTANYKTQYQVTFSQSGLSYGSTGCSVAGCQLIGTVVRIDGVNYTLCGLPVSFWWDYGSTHAFQFISPVCVDGVHYAWASTMGLSTLQSGGITVSSAGTITGKYIRK